MNAGLVPLRFEAFTPQHYGLLVLFVAVLAGLVVLGRLRGDDETFRRGFAVTMLVVCIPLQVLQLLPGDFDLGTSLPLQYCDLAWMVAVVALWTRRWWATALTFFWGLTFTVQAVVTPSLDETFPDPRFFMFWGMHLLTIWAAAWLAAAGGGPTWRGCRLAVVVTAVWAGVVMTFNAATGENYGFLNRKPSGTSLLDLFPGWPVYVLVEVVLVVSVWALLTWLFVRARERSGRGTASPSADRGKHP